MSFEDVDHDSTLGEEINSRVTILKAIDNPSRSSTLIETPAQGILNKTIGQFCEWTTSVHPKDYILDAPAHDHDIARLPV